MQVTVPVLTDATRRILKQSLDKHFTSPQGNDLDSVVAEVLHDQQLFTYLAAFLPKYHGLYLGSSSYWDDIRVYELYGLALDDSDTPRRTSLFTCEMVRGRTAFEHPLSFTQRLCLLDQRDIITPSNFCQQVNYALRQGKKSVVHLTFEDLRAFL